MKAWFVELPLSPSDEYDCMWVLANTRNVAKKLADEYFLDQYEESQWTEMRIRRLPSQDQASDVEKIIDFTCTDCGKQCGLRSAGTICFPNYYCEECSSKENPL